MHWPFWLGGIALAGVALATPLLTDRPLGISGALKRAVFGGPARASAAAILAGLILGGLLAAPVNVATISPDAAWRAVFAPLIGKSLAASPNVAEAALLLLGGVLVGAGTRIAGGCTSGHGLWGNALLRPASHLATAAFFGTGIVVALLLRSIT